MPISGLDVLTTHSPSLQMDLGPGRLVRRIFQSPALKTLLSVASAILSGVLSSSFVVEIAKPTGIEWSTFYLAKSFYALLVLICFLYLYSRALYQYETSVLQFLDNDYCTAYLRSQCLPEMAEKAKEQIRNGGVKDFTEAMDELKRGLR